MKQFKQALALLALALPGYAAFAHHSTNGMYNEETVIELTGKVVQWRFINPHPSLKLAVTAADGSVQEWDVSYGGSAVAHLKRRGFTADTFKPGDEISVKGNPALLEGAYGILAQGNPARPDGSAIVASPAPRPE